MFIRNTGKLAFAALRDGEAEIQLMLSLDAVGAESLAAWKADVDLGDLVWAHGEVITSRRGELSVLVDRWEIAAKALRPLPVAHKELSEDTRMRQRYVDLIMSPGRAGAGPDPRHRAALAARAPSTGATSSNSRPRSCNRCTAARRPGRSARTSTPSTPR